MSIERVRVEIRLDPASSLIGVVGGAVQFQASQAGFAPEACTEIADACDDVCREAASKLSDAEGGLRVTLESFADRLEISILHSGAQVPPVGLDTFAFSAVASGAGGINGLELLARVDRVLYNTEDGNVRTTLVKFRRPKK